MTRRTLQRLLAGAATVAAIVAALTAVAGTGFAAETAAQANYAPVNTAAPTITGTPQVGQTLTASNGTWTSDDAHVHVPVEPLRQRRQQLRLDHRRNRTDVHGRRGGRRQDAPRNGHRDEPLRLCVGELRADCGRHAAGPPGRDQARERSDVHSRHERRSP